MADIYNALVSGLQTPGKVVDSRDNGGKLRVFPFKFTFSGAGAAPTLFMAKIPAGVKIYGMNLQTDGLSTAADVGLTIDIGDDGDADRYAADFDADEANQSSAMEAAGHGHSYSVDTWIKGAVAAGMTPADTKILWGYFIGSAE